MENIFPKYGNANKITFINLYRFINPWNINMILRLLKEKNNLNN